MSLFAISDLHLSLGSDKPMDIFKGWENYVQRLEHGWRSVVNDHDTVVVGGDLSWALKLEETKKDFSFLQQLPGRKIVLKGNHDLWWGTIKKMNAYLAENEFDTVQFLHNNAVPAGNFCVAGTRGWLMDGSAGDRTILLREAGRLETSLREAEKTGLEPIVFLHYPPLYAQQQCPEILEVLYRYRIRRCYYGHIHGAGAAYAVQGERDGIHYRLISCDANGFVPVLIER